MAPKTSTPRLKDIVPTTLAEQASGAMRDHVYSLCIQVGLSVRDDGVDGLRFSIEALASYAVSANPLDATVEEYLISLLSFWACPIDANVTTRSFDDAYQEPDGLPPGWESELLVVMIAAITRERVVLGEPVKPSGLAVLSGLTCDHVRLLIRRGEITGYQEDGWYVSAEEARRWLASRGVVGFA